jgi:hypothetical protein
MNRNLLIGTGLAAALMLVLLVLAGGSKPAPMKPAPKSVTQSPIQKVAFMTQGSAPAPEAKAEKPVEVPKTDHK